MLIFLPYCLANQVFSSKNTVVYYNNSVMSRFHFRHIFNISLLNNNTRKSYQIWKIQLVQYYEKTKNEYDPKIKTVKYLKSIDQNEFWLIFNTASKVCRLPGHASSQSV